ncbi:MAG: TIGR02300 family protein [Xanthobacteraceae bacterium]
MANPALGTKRICSGCHAKFYDLGKDPIVCPTCETVFVIPKPEPARGGRRYAPRSVYDPNAQVASSMGTLREADAPDLADNEAKAEEVAETEDTDKAGAEEAGGVPMLEEFDEK